MTAGEPVLRVGDLVMWRGAWGTFPAVAARVTALQETDEPRSKYGREVEALPWSRVRANYAVVDLDTGNWAYGSQLEPMPSSTDAVTDGETLDVARGLVALEQAVPGVVKELELQRAIVVCGIAEVQALRRPVPSISRAEAVARGFVPGKDSTR